MYSIHQKNISVLAATDLPQWASSTTAGGTNNSYFNQTVTDSQGNIYTVGYIDGTGIYNLGNGVTVSGGYSSHNAIIVKYNSSGQAQWANSTALGGPANSFFYGVAVDSNDNPHAVGFIYTTGTFNFGNSVTVNGGYSTYNAAVVKYNSSGLAQWANSTALGGPSSSYFYNIAIDANNFVYCSGQISSNGQYNFGNSITVNGTYPGGYNATLVKYNSSGLAQLAKSTVTAPSTSNFNGISIDSTGKVYAVGSINTANTYNFGNSVTVSGGYSGGANAVIVKYDTEAIVPTPTPTPTSTQNQNSQNNSSSTSTTSSTPVCTDIKPLSVPDLFQINVTDTTAKIHFTPAKETNTYYVGFSEDLNAEKHGAQATLLTEGVQSYTIFKLKPNTIYYFKVKAQNGCTAGDWSNIMKIKTNPKNSSKINIFYKNYSLIQSITKIKSNQITETKNISADITPVITSTPQKEKVTPPTNQTTEIPKPEPKKLCIFKWCF